MDTIMRGWLARHLRVITVTARFLSPAAMLLVATAAFPIELESCLDVARSEDTVLVESLKATPPLVSGSDQRTGIEISVTLSRKVHSRCVVDLSVEGPEQTHGDSDSLEVVFRSQEAVATTTFSVTPIRDQVFDGKKETIIVRATAAEDVEPATILVEDGDKKPDSVLLSANIKGDEAEIAAEIKGEVTFARDTRVSLSIGGHTESTTIIIPANERVGTSTARLSALSTLLMPQIDSLANGERNEWQISPEYRSGDFVRVERSTHFDQRIPNIVSDALTMWVNTNRPKEKDDPHSRDLRGYLKKAYNIMLATGGPLIESTLRDLLGTEDANESAARLYDTEQFAEAVEIGTEHAYQSYLRAFPDGLHEQAASSALSELLLRVDNQCSSVELTDCQQCPKMIAFGTRSQIVPLAVSMNEITEGQFRRLPNEFRVDCWLYNYANDEWAWRKQDWVPAPSDRDNFPAVCVSWDDARNYTGWLSKESKREYRLLKDAEWEEISKACEPVEGNFMPSETKARECRDMRDFEEKRCEGGVTEVGRFTCSSIGVSDLHGNVWEWTADSPPEDDELRIVRGGSWIDDDSIALKQGRVFPEIRTGFTGFRVARSTTACPGGVILSASTTSTIESEEAILKISAEIEAKESDVEVQVIFSGDAEFGTDYFASTEKIVIPKGQRSGSLTLTVVDDELYENTETIRVDGKAEGLAVTGVEIVLKGDERDSGVALTVFPEDADESGGRQIVAIEAELSHATTETLEVHLYFDGTAVEGTDYRVSPRTPTIIIPAASSSGTSSLTFVPFEDDVDEGVGETIEITGAVRAPYMNVIGAGIQIKDG